MKEEFIERLKEDIADDKIEKVIHRLKELFKKNYEQSKNDDVRTIHKSIIIIANEYKTFQNDKDSGIIENASVQKNSILAKLLKIIESLEATDQIIYESNDTIRYRIEKVHFPFDTSDVDIIADAAIYVGEDRYSYKDTLINLLKERRLVPTKYLYSIEEGCKLWLEMCNRPEYTFYYNSIKHLQKIKHDLINKAAKALNSYEFDYISLGCGNGLKDQIIIEKMCELLPNSNKKNAQIYFYPVDISVAMLTAAIKTIFKGDTLPSSEIREKVSMKAILADITNIFPIRGIYEYRKNLNLISILGNTLGNSSEREILLSLKDAMIEKDLLLIEININQNFSLKYDNLYDETNKSRHFIPLKSIGLQFDSKKVTYEVLESGFSVIQGTKTTVAKCKDVQISGKKIQEVVLATIHHYNIKEFIKHIERNLGVDLVYESEYNDVGVLMFQKNSLVMKNSRKEAKRIFSDTKKIFVSYSKQDVDVVEKGLINGLKNLKRQGKINIWYDKELKAGDEWDNEIKKQLKEADIILLVVSPDFIAAKYIQDIEIRKAIERHDNGEAIVIPIILRPCDWTGDATPFSKLKAIPAKGTPITKYDNQDDAWLEVIEQIKKVIF